MKDLAFDACTIFGARIISLSRHGGTSQGNFASLNIADYVGDDKDAVVANIARVSLIAGADVALMRAEHGVRSAHVSVPGPQAPSDILISADGSTPLVAIAADCLPIAFVNSKSPALAVVHAGWRGVAAGAIDVALDAYAELGIDLATSHAVIGPSICGSCYEVGPDVIEAVGARAPNAIRDATHVDLSSAAVLACENRGVAVTVLSGCTFENDNLFSYRRARGMATGRGGIVVTRNNEEAR